MGAGDQSNENAAEQFKDEQISDGACLYSLACMTMLTTVRLSIMFLAIRDAYKENVGSDFPVADK